MPKDTESTVSAYKFLCGHIKHICRMCFATTEDNLSIQDTVWVQKRILNETVSIEKMLCEIGANIEPLMPKSLCSKCATAVINSYIFKKQCQHSENTWNQVLTKLEQNLSQIKSTNVKVKTLYVNINQDQIENTIYSSSRDDITTSQLALKNFRRLVVKRNREGHLKACPECGKQYRDIGRHIKTHRLQRTKETVQCSKCGKSFSTTGGLQIHMERIHYQKNLQCSQCAKMFSTKYMLKEHETASHITRTCKLCYQQFPSKGSFRSHMNKKHKTVQCVICGKQFAKTYHLRHLEICGRDNRNPEFYCDLCDKGYISKVGLQIHMIDHGFGVALKCDWCDKKFMNKSQLDLHILKHTRERKFSCEECSGKFVTKAALKYHTRIHTGERPYSCDLCGERFLSSSRRAEHRRKHFEPKEECTVCDAKFRTKYQLRKHISRHSNPESKLYVETNNYK